MPDAEPPRAQGTPCWLDLSAADPAAALDFYRPLFGWTGEPRPEAGGYAILETGRDGPAAAIGPRQPHEDAAAAAWTTYFAVADADATARRITEHNGRVLLPPGEIPGAGRMAIAADPGGAVFGLWQAAPFAGFVAQTVPGSAVWFELCTAQGKMAAAFYGAVFDTPVSPMDQMPDEYWLVSPGGVQAAGIWEGLGSPLLAQGPRWQPYFLVADADATVAAAEAAGGQVVIAPQDSPYGRMAALTDPHGAHFSVITGGS